MFSILQSSITRFVLYPVIKPILLEPAIVEILNELSFTVKFFLKPVEWSSAIIPPKFFRLFALIVISELVNVMFSS